MAKRNRNQQGFSMIEVLVTLFVMSVGLLGVVSMQFVGSFNNKSALARTQAVFVAQQMAERLRANMAPSRFTDGYVADNQYFDGDNYNFNNLVCVSGDNDFDCFCNSIPASIPNCLSGECSVSEFARFDAYQMSCAAVAANPAAEIFVTCNDTNTADADACTAGSLHQIMVRWPAKGWQNSERIASSACNVSGYAKYDCVALELLL